MIWIKTVEVRNWKVYASYHREDFTPGLNIICRPNGHGKTSIFQAIMLTMFNILPTNNTFTSMANDPTIETSLKVTMSNGLVFSRKMLNGKTIEHAVYSTDGKRLTGIGREVITYAKKCWIDSAIVTALWSNTGTCLNWKFFQTNILGALLNDPTTISNKLKAKIFQIKKQIGNRNPRTKVELESMIKRIETTLAQSTNASSTITNAQYGLAVESGEAWKKLQTMTEPTLNQYDAERIITIGNTYEANQKALDTCKTEAETIDELGAERATAASSAGYLSYLQTHGSEPISQSPVSKDIITGLGHVNRYLTLKQRTEESKAAWEKIDEAKSAIKYWKTKQRITVPEWETVIQTYNEDNEKAQEKRNKMLTAYKSLSQELEERKKIDELSAQLDHWREIKAWVDDYLLTATSAYSQSFLSQCNADLVEFSDRYTAINLYDGVFYLTKTDGQVITVGQMSSGERGVVDVIIRLALSRMTGAPIPILFDESFANMDTENLASIKKMMTTAATKSQIFVITHNEEWRKEIE